MLRFDIINKVIEVNGFTKYLEIGVCNPLDCFDKINCELKHGVDPGYEFEENPVTYQMESDTFFEYLKEHDPNRKYDVIFIDGLHKSYQVKKDIEENVNRRLRSYFTSDSPHASESLRLEAQLLMDMRDLLNEWDSVCNKERSATPGSNTEEMALTDIKIPSSNIIENIQFHVRFESKKIQKYAILNIF